jgi:hypothetical protein
VTYDYLENGNPVTDAVYVVEADGSTSGSAPLSTPPFRLQVNFTDADPENGLPVNLFGDPGEPEGVRSFVDPTETTVDQFVGREYVRFRITLDDPSDPEFAQTNVQITLVEFELDFLAP